MYTFDRLEYERFLVSLRLRLDQASWAAGWAAGRAMTLEQVVAHMLDYRL